MLVLLSLVHVGVNAGCSRLVGVGTYDNGHEGHDADSQRNVVDRFVPGTVPERLWSAPYNTSYPDGTGPIMHATSDNNELVYLLLGDLELRRVVTVNITSGTATSVKAAPSASWVFLVRSRAPGKPFHAVASNLVACGPDPYGPLNCLNVSVGELEPQTGEFTAYRANVRFQQQVGIGDFLFEASAGESDASLLMFQTIAADAEGTVRTFGWTFGAGIDKLNAMTACTRPGPEFARGRLFPSGPSSPSQFVGLFLPDFEFEPPCPKAPCVAASRSPSIPSDQERTGCACINQLGLSLAMNPYQ